MKTLRKVDPMSAAKLAGIAGLIWGLVIGILIFAGIAVTQYMGRFYRGYVEFVPGMTGNEIIVLPVAYAVTGFVGAYILAILYNFVAKKFGGIKVDLK